jgi:sterol desaturase/sphingolipid hydroxylase (fatty acid hydroxylase superfamily)
MNHELSTINYMLPERRHPVGEVFLYFFNVIFVFIAGVQIGPAAQLYFCFIRGLAVNGSQCGVDKVHGLITDKV